MAGDFDDIVFPQIALFAVLIIILVWVLSKNLLLSVVAGGVALYLGMNGDLESLGIGPKTTVYRCADYLVHEKDLENDTTLKDYVAKAKVEAEKANSE